MNSIPRDLSFNLQKMRFLHVIRGQLRIRKATANKEKFQNGAKIAIHDGSHMDGSW